MPPDSSLNLRPGTNPSRGQDVNRNTIRPQATEKMRVAEVVEAFWLSGPYVNAN
jgi:hypothetical protein